MQVQLEWRDDKILIAWMDGDLDAANQETIKAEFRRMVDQSPKGVILNFAKAHYVSSLGIGMIVELRRSLKDIGAELRITGVDSRVRLVLDTANITKMIPIEATLDGAILHLRKNTPAVA